MPQCAVEFQFSEDIFSEFWFCEVTAADQFIIVFTICRTGEFRDKIPYAFLNWIFAAIGLLNYLIVTCYNGFEEKFFEKLMRTRKVRYFVSLLLHFVS